MMKKILASTLAAALFMSSVSVVASADTIPSSDEVMEPQISAAADVRVVSYNVFVEARSGDPVYDRSLRAPRMVTVLKKYQADSIGLQECSPEWMAYLTEHLTDYAFVGVGRENGLTNASSGEASPIFYLKDKYELLESNTFWLSETPDRPSISWGAAYKRVCTYAVLKNKTTGKRYLHINTHLDYMTDASQLGGVKLIQSKIAELRKKYADLPVVATGDWNMDQTSQAYSLMVNNNTQVDMEDALYCVPADKIYNEGGTGPQLTGAYNYKKDLPIDHVFVSIDQFNPQMYQVMHDTVDGLRVSDHYGICVELKYGAGTLVRSKAQMASSETAVRGTPDAIDGVKDAVYDNAPEIKIDSTIMGSGNTLGSAYLTFDDDCLYCFVEVHDTTVSQGNTDSAYETDAVQIYYDFLNSDTKPDEAYSFRNGESGYCYLYPKDNSKTSGNATGTNLVACESGARTADGYTVEAKIKLSDSMKERLKISDSVAMGIGIQINDDENNDNKREGLIVNDIAVNNAWATPSYLTELVMNRGLSKAYRFAPGTAVVDGTMDASYLAAEEVAVNRDMYDKVVDPGDNTHAYGDARTIYDENYIYSFIEVHDTTPFADDGVQIAYDFSNNKGHDEAAGHVYLNGIFGYIDTTRTTGLGDNCFSMKAEDCTVTKKGTGYTVEIRTKLPDELKEKIKDNPKTEIGAGFQINNRYDNAGKNTPTLSNSLVNNTLWLSDQNVRQFYPKAFLVKDHSITVSQPSGGTVTVPTSAATGSVVTVQTVPNEGYAVESVSVNGQLLNGNTFEMPDADVTVTASFVDQNRLFNITVDPALTGGTITADKKTARAGEKVTVTVTPDDGKYTYSYLVNQTVTESSYFIMPYEDVTVSTTFYDRPVRHAASGRPVLDGDMDQVYSDAEKVLVNRGSTNTAYQQGRALGAVRTVCDYEKGYIYCFAEVTDATPESSATRPVSDSYSKRLDGVDGITFFFDFQPEGQKTWNITEVPYVAGESGAYYCDLASAKDNLTAEGVKMNRLTGGFAGYTARQASYVAKKTEKGYQIELKIAMSDTLKAKKVLNNVPIGIGFLINDDQNDDGVRDSYAYSFGAEAAMGYAPNSPKYLGTMLLSNAPISVPENSSVIIPESGSGTSSAASSAASSATSSESGSAASSESSSGTSSTESLKSSSAASSAETASIPKTGDSSGLLLWFAFLFLAAAGLVFLVPQSVKRTKGH